MTDAGRAELIFVLVLMFFILVFGLIAVAIFYRVWRRERHREAARARRLDEISGNGQARDGSSAQRRD